MDRGVYSVEVMILLLSMKINFPSTFVLLRGNHECRQMTISFTFRQEVLLKYDQEIFEAFCSLFDHMPLSCIINGKFIAVHAGISPELKTLSDLNKINRFHGKESKFPNSRNPQKWAVLRSAVVGSDRNRGWECAREVSV